MGLFEHWPYTNFHDLNLDWIVKKIKNVETAETTTEEYAEAAAESAAASQESAEAAAGSAEAAAGSAEESANSAASIAGKADQIDLNTARIDNILVSGTPTEGNAELIDIRVGADTITYSTAGDAVRGQYERSIKSIYSDADTIYNSILNGMNFGILPFKTGFRYNYVDDSTPIDIDNPTKFNIYSCCVIPCNPNEVYTFNVSTGINVKSYIILDENKIPIASANGFAEPHLFIIRIPENGAYIIIQSRNIFAENPVNFWAIKGYQNNGYHFIEYLNNINVTDLRTCLKSGWYSCSTSYLINITDLPEDFPNVPLFMNVYHRSASSSLSYTRQELYTTDSCWIRMLDNKGNVTTDWKKNYGPEPENVRACIIGASIEAGTTHETPTSGAVIDRSKAYLTVALQNNNVAVTNLSHGGMGYLRTASDSSVFKNIVDNTDFNDFECCYLCLGSNDWNYNFTLGSSEDTAGSQSVLGMLKYGIEKILTSNPYIKIFVKIPDIRATKGNFDTLWGWNANNAAADPYTLKMLADGIKEVCNIYSIETMGDRGTNIVNAYNIMTVYPDGTHPSQKTMALMALNMTGRIKMK